jgi:hypothetical protein
MISLAKIQPQTFNWTITTPDPNNPGSTLPVDDCENVIATLYAGRSQVDPDTIPGSPVPDFTNLTLEFTSDGVYTLELDSTFDPPASGNYVIVIDVDRDSLPFGHWEEATTVYVNT